VPLIYEEGNVEAHIFFDDEMPQVRCFDKRRGTLQVQVVMNLLSHLPDGYGEEAEDLPTPDFVVEAIQSVTRHLDQLWPAWEQIRREF